MDDLANQQEEINSVSGGAGVRADDSYIYFPKCGKDVIPENFPIDHKEGSGCNKTTYYKITCPKCGNVWVVQ